MTAQIAGRSPMPIFELDAPVPDFVTAMTQARKRRPAVLAERSLLLSPLALLAACGGGGGGGGGPAPIPAPPGGSPSPSPTPTPTPGQSGITAQPDAIAVTAGAAAATGNLLSNDTATSGTLSVSAVAVQNGAAGTVGQPLAGTLGTLTVNADGTYSFAAANNAAVQALAAGQTATNVFTYTPSVGANAGTPQTVTATVTGVNDAPTAVADSGFNVVKNAATTTVSGNVRTNDTDPDSGAALTVSAVAGGSVGSAVQGTYGSVVINADGTFTYTLNNADPDTQALGASASATESFTYTISDGSATSSATLSVTVTGTTGGGGGGGGGSGPSSINLGALGAAGATIAAPVSGGRFGFAIGTVQPGGTGDVNGDGRADLVVAAPFGASGTGAGQVYVFSGSALTGAAVRTLSGASAGDRFGYDIGVGNIGGDSKADVLVGAPGVTSTNANAGAVYGFFGGGLVNGAAATPTGANGLTLTISNSEGTVAYPNASGDLGPNLGAAVAILGDVNGDSRGDYFVAVPGLNAAPLADVGDAYVGFGQTSYPGSSIGVGSLATPGMGFRTQSDQINDGEGFTAAASGDINGSGGADLVIADARRGSVVVRFGDVTPSGTTTQNADITGANGVRLFSSEANARFGESIAVGDINNDGRADVIVGAPGAGGDGKVYVLLGAASYAGASIDVASSGGTVIEIDGTGGFGSSVAFIGDFNGDGRGDFAVGAPTDGATGSAYIILGSATPSASAFNLTTSANVIKLSGGAAGTGVDVAGPGDLNGDGRADVAIGAANDGSNATGAVYVVYGQSIQASSAIGQEALVLDDGAGQMFGDSHSGAAVHIELPAAANDLPPAELFI